MSGTQRIFRTVAMFHMDTLVVGTWPYLICLSKPIRRTTPKMNFIENCIFYVVMIIETMYHSKRDLGGGETMCDWNGACGNPLHFSARFGCKLAP